MTNSSTRITRDDVLDLCEAIHASGPLPVFGARVLGLFLCVRLTLTYLRHNPCQELLAEAYCVSQATVSRVIAAYTPLIAACLNGSVPTVEDLDPTAQLIIDGTLLQCWSWRDHPELYSGKHKTTGLNVQVACALSGTLAWVSDPQDGCTHDAKALRRSGLLDVPATDLPDGTPPPRHIGDKGYIGLLGVFRTVLVLCFRLPSSGPGNRFRPRRECDTLGLSEDEYDCISARSMRQYP